MNTSSSCSMWVLENAIFNIMLLDYERGMSCKDRWKWKERIKSISHMFGKLAWIKVRKRKIYMYVFLCNKSHFKHRVAEKSYDNNPITNMNSAKKQWNLFRNCYKSLKHVCRRDKQSLLHNPTKLQILALCT